MSFERATESRIGRVKTVLVAPEDTAIVSTIIADCIPREGSPRLSFCGTVEFEESVRAHLEEIVLIHVDDILMSLNQTLPSFTLSAISIGAATSSEVDISITGFSIDASVFLALLSSALDIPVRQNIVITGHLGSSEGDILPVESLPAKCRAALLDTNVSAIVYPSLDSDISFKSMKANSYAEAIAAVRSCRGKLEVNEVRNTTGLIEKALDSIGIVLGALENDFFEKDGVYYTNERLSDLVGFLTAKNQAWFWDVLGENLLLRQTEASHKLIETFANYHIRKARYPTGFGEKLERLIISLPAAIRNASGLFPLLTKDLYIRLIQGAGKHDYDDVSLLHGALYDKTKIRRNVPGSRVTTGPESTERDGLLSYMLEQLSPAFIEAEITRPYDEARAKYVIESITVETNDEFLDVVTAFFSHILHHTNKIQGSPDQGGISAEALAVLNRTFPGKKGYNEALSEARNGTRGGLRFLMDAMTEYLKQEAREKHILKTFKENIDPLDFVAKTRIIEEIIRLSGHFLPEHITLQPPERYALDYEEIVKAYIKSNTALESVFMGL